jgi:hypothetical protein
MILYHAYGCETLHFAMQMLTFREKIQKLLPQTPRRDTEVGRYGVILKWVDTHRSLVLYIVVGHRLEFSLEKTNY